MRKFDTAAVSAALSELKILQQYGSVREVREVAVTAVQLNPKIFIEEGDVPPQNTVGDVLKMRRGEGW